MVSLQKGTGRKRDLSVFDAIEELESQDRRAERKRRKETNVEKNRALEVQSQTKIYNHLLESRILLQRAMKKADGFSSSNYNSVSEGISSKKSTFRETCDSLLQNLLLARCKLFGSSNDDSDKYESLVLPSLSSVTSLRNSLQNEYEEHRDHWKKILNRKHKNLHLRSGLTAKTQFRILNSSFWEQVEATVEYEEIRQNDEKKTPELFDDSKVYQQLLKDFVANSTSGAAGGVNSLEAIASPIKYKNNNKSNKKDVDRRASKGRKIRYKSIPKLVNFTFPLSRPNASNLERDEYFQSLFGGAGTLIN
mmetsp:Transcript_18285/g.42090  ORF Transcript_18285/g.42090 Transcript_18285/m.42090 type:complete len:307 (-) Transcript_18285:439-1359(-)